MLQTVLLAQEQTMPTIQIIPAHGVAFSNMKLYLNSTDGNYHLKGFVKNTLQVSVDDIDIMLHFDEKVTNTTVHEPPHILTRSVSPNETIRFDADTRYTKAQEINFNF